MILKTHRRRIAAAALLLFAMFAVVTVRLARLQLFEAGRFGPNGPCECSIHRSRGMIFDRNMNKLALSVPVLSLFADPHRVDDPRLAAERLAPVLFVDEAVLLRRLTEDKHFVWLARKLERETVAAVKALGIKGLGFKREDKRQYPSGTLAANVIGFAGIDEEGLEGVEYQHDSILAAEPGLKLVFKGPGGLEMPNGTVVVKAPEGGSHVVLTIDGVIQHLAEKEAQSLFERWKPKSCFILVQQPKTGEILACAVRPTFDPNRYASFPRRAYKNRAITDIYEPGSVFKIVTASAALEDRRVTPDTRFHCPGFVKVYGVTMGCTGVHGTITVRQAIEKSCNSVMAKVGRLLGPKSFYYYIRKFGFGEKTGIELPGEQVGLVRLPDQWSGISSSAISIGQEIGVTGIQMVTAVSVIANGGMLVRPQIVRKVLSYDRKKELRSPAVVFRRRVVSEDVARTMAGMMEQVVVEGTGARAKLDRYTAAGKTGTSQKLGAGKKGKKVVSFAGFLPVHSPAVTIYVVVNEPQAENPRIIAGGRVAAPAFKNLARKIMTYLGVPPDRLVASSELARRRGETRGGGTAAGPAPATATVVPRRSAPLLSVAGRMAGPMDSGPDEMSLDSADGIDDPVAAVLDSSIAPLPGLAGIGPERPREGDALDGARGGQAAGVSALPAPEGGRPSDFTQGPGQLSVDGDEIERVIDAELRRSEPGATEAGASFGP